MITKWTLRQGWRGRAADSIHCAWNGETLNWVLEWEEYLRVLLAEDTTPLGTPIFQYYALASTWHVWLWMILLLTDFQRQDLGRRLHLSYEYRPGLGVLISLVPSHCCYYRYFLVAARILFSSKYHSAFFLFTVKFISSRGCWVVVAPTSSFYLLYRSCYICFTTILSVRLFTLLPPSFITFHPHPHILSSS